MKKNIKGITLVALVITIVVLLILAGISIQAITNTGLFSNAKRAAEESKYANAAEKVALAVNASYDSTGKINDDYLKENVNKIEGLSKKIDTVTYDLKIIVDGFEFTISESGKITGEKKEVATLPDNTPQTDAGTNVKIEDSWRSQNVKYIKTTEGTEITTLEKVATVYAVSDGQNNTIPVPNGFYYVGGNKNSGVVISDDERDKNKFAGQANVPAGVVYNSDGTVNTDQSSNSSPTKEKLLNKSYSDIKKDLNDTNKVYWGGSKGNERKYKGIDDNSSLSDSDKKEIKEKWAEEAVKNSSGNIDANVKEYLSAEINAIKDKRYYRNPAVNTEDSSSGLDDAISDADSFIETGDNNKLQISSLQAFSRNIYNILLTIGIVVAVLTGAIIGIKYMLGSVEEKADIKGLLIPYIAGCVIIFGSFAIWKLIVTLLQGI